MTKKTKLLPSPEQLLALHLEAARLELKAVSELSREALKRLLRSSLENLLNFKLEEYQWSGGQQLSLKEPGTYWFIKLK
jgi:hypothetical protein